MTTTGVEMRRVQKGSHIAFLPHSNNASGPLCSIGSGVWQLGVPVPWCGIHPHAQGTSKTLTHSHMDRFNIDHMHSLQAFGPVTTMACAVAAGLEPPHTNLMLSVFIIGVGVATASCANDKLSYVGIIVQFLAMLSESARLVLTQKLLQGYSFNASMCSGFGAANALEYHVSNPSHTVEGLMYTSPACIFWLFLGWLVFESQRMIAANAFAKIAAAPLLYCCAAALGFLVNVTAYWTIQLTGGLTIKVLGTVKNAIVVLLGMIFLAEPVTALQLVGYGTSIGGFALYNWHKMHTAPPGYIHGSEKETQQPSLTEVKTVAVG